MKMELSFDFFIVQTFKNNDFGLKQIFRSPLKPNNQLIESTKMWLERRYLKTKN